MVHSIFAQSTVQRTKVLDAGTITGSVRLKDNPTAYEPMEITKDSKYCGKSKPSPRLIVGKNNGIQNAIVYLQDFTALEKINENFKVTLDQKKCEYVPHIMIVPHGAQLDIVNSDPILHNVHAYETQDAPKSLFNIAQPIKGQRTAIKRSLLEKPGIIEATCDAGHPWMSAYIMVASHSYYTITDKNGEYKLENVPPGN
ncbi:MAG TPA: hypothetical protein VFF29_05375, partial [Bacteroidota bacterium]|nr:hypothetical protein [Bacteroidota bacterium]